MMLYFYYFLFVRLKDSESIPLSLYHFYCIVMSSNFMIRYFSNLNYLTYFMPAPQLMIFQYYYTQFQLRFQFNYFEFNYLGFFLNFMFLFVIVVSYFIVNFDSQKKAIDSYRIYYSKIRNHIGLHGDLILFNC